MRGCTGWRRSCGPVTPAGPTSIDPDRALMEQLESQLPAAGGVLDDAALDRIDEIVKPGVNLNPQTPAAASTSYGPPPDAAGRRRRPSRQLRWGELDH